MKTSLLASLALAACLGCGSDGGEASRGVVLKEGQFFRFVNATPSNLVIAFDTLRVQEPYTPADSPCSFRKASPRPHKVVVTDEAGKPRLSKTLDFKSGAIVTYVLTEDGGKLNLTSYANESRGFSQADSAVRLIGEASTGVSLAPKTAGTPVALADGATSLPPGGYNVVVDGKKVESVELETKIGYSLLAFRRAGAVKTILLRNSPEPMQTTNANVSQAGG